MNIYQHPNEIQALGFGATIGNFDGVHLGHIAMLKTAKEECHKRHLDFAVITFFPHPLQILKAMRGFLICDYEDRRKHLAEAGVQHLIEIPFTRDFSSTGPEAFVQKYIKDVKNFNLLCMGYDFAFGANKGGNFSTVSTALDSSQVEVISLCEHRPQDEQVSSTKIRELIRQGKVDEVPKLMGRTFSLQGYVVKGKGRGKGIGFPTANLGIGEEVITPSTGVYATRSTLRNKTYMSVTNIGFNPTFNDNLHMTIETNVMGLDEDFYDELMRVEFVEKIREEKRFNSIDDLKKQISQDVNTAAGILRD